MDDTELDVAFGFSSEFSYEFDSIGTELVHSGSTGTKSSDDEDFFTELTRRSSHTSLNETRKKQQLLTVPICNNDEVEVMITKKTHCFLPFLNLLFQGS